MMWASLLKAKAYVFKAFKRFKMLAEAEKTQKIRCLRTCSGGEFVSNEYTPFFNRK